MSVARPNDTRARIEAAALALFAAKGVDGASTRDIAKAVGVTEGALYRHFASKDALAKALFRDRYGRFARAIETIRSKKTPFDEKVRALVAFFYASFDDDPDAFAYVLISQHDHLRDLDPNAPENAVAALTQLIEDAMAAGDIPKADVPLTAALALGLVVQPAIFRIYGRLAEPPSAHVETVSAAVLRAVSSERSALQLSPVGRGHEAKPSG